MIWRRKYDFGMLILHQWENSKAVRNLRNLLTKKEVIFWLTLYEPNRWIFFCPNISFLNREGSRNPNLLVSNRFDLAFTCQVTKTKERFNAGLSIYGWNMQNVCLKLSIWLSMIENDRFPILYAHFKKGYLQIGFHLEKP